MYKHCITRFNYTSYDIRRAQDTVNARTSHCNVMVLADDDGDESPSSGPASHFLYARVLGTYHVNVIYVGPGSVDFTAHRLEFLWV